MLYQAKDTLHNDSLLIAYLQTWNTDAAHKLLVPIFLKNNDWTNAQNSINNIAIKTQTDIDYVDYFTFMIGFAQSKNKLTSVTANDKNTLQNIVNNKTLVSNLAENLLMKINEGNYQHYIMPIGNKTPRLANEQTSKLYSKSAFSIFSNPSNGNFNIELANFERGNNYQIIVSDILGLQLSSQNLNATITSIDISAFSNGVYLLTLYESNKFMSTQKAIVIH